jgi:molybdenum cofactor synthesis domain-containing protein
MIKKEKYSAAILVIGDEILSGRTQDTNSNYIAKEMEMIGINTTQIRVIPDEKNIIIESVNELRAKNDYLFTTGGIGPTHDDITADSIAEAFKVDLEVNIEAYDVLEKYYKKIGSEFNEVRQRMARIPKGATLIENSISAAPGFKIENVFVFAGIPKSMKSMLEDSIKYLSKGKLIHTISIKVDAVEGDIAPVLKSLNNENENIKIGSYPFFNSNNDFGVSVVIKSIDKDFLILAEEKLKNYLSKNSFNFK